MKKSELISFGSLLVAIISLFISSCSYHASVNSNGIASKALGLSQQEYIDDKSDRSDRLIDVLYDKIYYNEINQLVISKIKTNKVIEIPENLLRVVDIFEEVGIKYCGGTIYRRHIKTAFRKDLEFVCDDTDIFDRFPTTKNGLAMLCHEFYPQSKMASVAKFWGDCHFDESDIIGSFFGNRWTKL